MSNIFSYLEGSSKYKDTYIKVIQSIQKLQRVKRPKSHKRYVYYEHHHIIPQCIQPRFKNLKHFPENGVLLTPKEHFIVHKLLYKHYEKAQVLDKDCLKSLKPVSKNSKEYVEYRKKFTMPKEYVNRVYKDYGNYGDLSQHKEAS